VTLCPKAGILEPEEKAVAKQRLGKCIPATTNIVTSSKIKLGDYFFPELLFYSLSTS
jgi:hypothetical protein